MKIDNERTNEQKKLLHILYFVFFFRSLSASAAAVVVVTVESLLARHISIAPFIFLFRGVRKSSPNCHTVR